jgi:hypothetical protein
MKNWAKLALPIGLGIVAGIMHYQVLAPALTPHAYCQMNCDRKPGDVIDKSCLTSITLPGDFKRRAQTLVPYEDLAAIIGSHATRELYKGDVVFYSDTTHDELSPLPNEADLTVRLPAELVSPGTLRVGASLLFYVKKKTDDHNASNKPETLGPYRMLAIGGLADGKYGLCNVRLAFPRNRNSGTIDPRAAQLIEALRGNDKSVLGIELCEPAASLSPGKPATGRTAALTDRQGRS